MGVLLLGGFVSAPNMVSQPLFNRYCLVSYLAVRCAFIDDCQILVSVVSFGFVMLNALDRLK